MKNSPILYHLNSESEKDLKTSPIGIDEPSSGSKCNEFVPEDYTVEDLNKAFSNLFNSINKINHDISVQSPQIITTKDNMNQILKKVLELKKKRDLIKKSRSKQHLFLQLAQFFKVYQPLFSFCTITVFFLSLILNIVVQFHTFDIY